MSPCFVFLCVDQWSQTHNLCEYHQIFSFAFLLKVDITFFLLIYNGNKKYSYIHSKVLLNWTTLIKFEHGNIIQPNLTIEFGNPNSKKLKFEWIRTNLSELNRNIKTIFFNSEYYENQLICQRYFKPLIIGLSWNLFWLSTHRTSSD